MVKIAKRGKIPAFIVMDVMRAANQRAAAGGEVLHMEVGQPGTSAPAGVIAAAHRALDSDRLGYTEAFGLPDLRARIAQHYLDFYGQEVRAERIVVTTGSSGAFLVTCLAAFDAGDRIALASPSYPAYRNMMTALGIEPVLLPTTMADRFQPTVERLAKIPNLEGLIVNSPTNPAGTMVSPDELAALAAYCHGRGIRLISDEIYHGVTFTRPAATAAVYDDAVVINSFSKYFSMTGWRIGWAVLPENLLRPIECLLQNFFISVPALSQMAALAAFDCQEELQANVAVYARNRELLLEQLPKAGFDRLAPVDGAFYVYADVSALTNDSTEFCRRMLNEIGVAATPGLDFDPQRGDHFVRFSFAGAEPEIAAAAANLIRWQR
ncbi:MAG: pyridoxal phosphate-dependent aminotransferase [Alphaproteobacteria bacterium]